MSKEPNPKITLLPKAETPKRKFIGFYLNSLGEIKFIQEGLSEKELLKLLGFGEVFCRNSMNDYVKRRFQSDA